MKSSKGERNDAETGGNLLLTDTHSGTEAIDVELSLFVVAIGSGTITSGLAVSLPEVFSEYGEVWMEGQVYNTDPAGWDDLLAASAYDARIAEEAH